MEQTEAYTPLLKQAEKAFALLDYDDAMGVFERKLLQYAKSQSWARSFLAEMKEKYDKPRLQGSPASPHNQERHRDDSLNYFAPTKNLQVILCEEWFDKVSADKKKYTVEWREKFVTDLMASEYRDKIAEDWAKPDQRLQIKGRVIGALIAAGVINKKALAVARTFYNNKENTAEVKTLAKYMGDSRREFYTDWIKEYVAQQP